MFFFPLSLKKKRVGFRNVLTSGLIARAYMRLEIVQSNSMRHGEVERESSLVSSWETAPRQKEMEGKQDKL